jgi:hypothetical protein
MPRVAPSEKWYYGTDTATLREWGEELGRNSVIKRLRCVTLYSTVQLCQSLTKFYFTWGSFHHTTVHLNRLLVDPLCAALLSNKSIQEIWYSDFNPLLAEC